MALNLCKCKHSVGLLSGCVAIDTHAQGLARAGCVRLGFHCMAPGVA